MGEKGFGMNIEKDKILALIKRKTAKASKSWLLRLQNTFGYNY
jgi:hypothetical protein